MKVSNGRTQFVGHARALVSVIRSLEGGPVWAESGLVRALLVLV